MCNIFFQLIKNLPSLEKLAKYPIQNTNPDRIIVDPDIYLNTFDILPKEVNGCVRKIAAIKIVIKTPRNPRSTNCKFVNFICFVFNVNNLIFI